MKQPSKRTPTPKELGQMRRLYGGTDNLIFGKNGYIAIRRQVR